MDIKVIFRKVRWTAPSGKTFTDVEAFFPELSASYGKICGYCRSEGWFESNLDYYWVSKPAAEHEYKELLKYLQAEFNGDVLTVRKRIAYNDLSNSWAEYKREYERMILQ